VNEEEEEEGDLFKGREGGKIYVYVHVHVMYILKPYIRRQGGCICICTLKKNVY